MSYTNIISTDDFAGILDKPDVKIFDGSYAMSEPHPREAFVAQRIEGAQFFDIDDIADPNATLTHMLPPPDIFAEKVRALGINKEDQIVVYAQNHSAMAACRVWWMFRTFGHDKIAVLDGGLTKWTQEGRPTISGAIEAPEPGDFEVLNFRRELVSSADDVLANIESKQFLTVDARDPNRFAGTTQEPRPGMASGHVPGSVNLFFMDLFTPEMTFKSGADLKALLQQAGIKKDTRVYSSCGSGVTACPLAVVMQKLGYADVAIYDGSWSEWGAHPDLPKATGNTGISARTPGL